MAQSVEAMKTTTTRAIPNAITSTFKPGSLIANPAGYAANGIIVGPSDRHHALTRITEATNYPATQHSQLTKLLYVVPINPVSIHDQQAADTHGIKAL